ncbi:MAG: iron-containing alcohol dehydrogenase, partial [Deltaproteobacteria bacterium]|nr:iron-containing alcohol dehydrogenase [Deltaproteobacteria bacterium]
GGRFDVHHGLANAVLLPYVMEFNLQARPEKFTAVAEALGVDTDGLTAHEAAAEAAMQSGNITANPRKTRQKDLEEILKKAI